MKKNNKLIKIIIVILVVYAVIMLIFLRKNDSNNIYFVLDNDMNLLYRNNTYSVVKNEIISDNNYLYDSYDNGLYIGKLKLMSGTSWNLFDNDDNFIMYDGYLFAVSSNDDITTIEFASRNLNDEDKEYIKNNSDINNFDYLLSEEVYDIDLDNNGIIDKIYLLTNSYFINDKQDFLLDYKGEYEYSVFYIKFNDKFIKVKEDINKNNVDIYQLKGIYKLKGDKVDNLVIHEIRNPEGDAQRSISSIYKYSNLQNNFVKIVSNYKD